jgi:hypothetical protein
MLSLKNTYLEEAVRKHLGRRFILLTDKGGGLMKVEYILYVDATDKFGENLVEK